VNQRALRYPASFTHGNANCGERITGSMALGGQVMFKLPLLTNREGFSDHSLISCPCAAAN